MESSDIDSDSLQAVKSLRSKFEKLAQPLPLSSPRPRAISSTQLDISDAIQLRPSSSSSDLTLLPAKRAPPPPPPPRASSKLLNNNPSPSPSPSPSPLLRPVPVPLSLVSPTEKELVYRSNSLKADLRPSIPPRPSSNSPSRSPRPATVPPPRPPPRPSASAGRVEPATAFISSSAPNLKLHTTSPPPPPLPVRRGANPSSEELASVPPPLPSRSMLTSPVNADGERKPLGASKLPPPPTRTIGLGDKLPPPRRPTTPSSDEESGEEDESRVSAVDLMPDSSTSSRRPPHLAFREGISESRIHVHQTGCVAISGTHVVVGHSHHIRIFDLAKSEVPLLCLDTKDIGAKDSKVTCMEFRPTASQAERGYLLWVGTKEGHIFELDIRTGIIRGIKYAAHLHHIAHMFRHSRSMVTLDESGKALVFSPDVLKQDDISLAGTVPRVVRTTEKQDFVKMLDGKLWTAARADHHHNSLTQKLPIIRVFDLFNPASTGRSILPTEHVGPITSAAILPSHPSVVYVGHEEGFISIWDLLTSDGYPRCADVIKVSASDVLSLEGVNDRLWAGSRNGMICAYDVAQKPWVVTNCWSAHTGVPVVKLMVNHYAIVSVGRLCVVSVGRDEQMRLWDGLLGWDWVDKELVKSEASFSTFRDLSILVLSWNCDSARPDALLTGSPQNQSFLTDVLHSVPTPPDIIVFGFQEVIDLESRKMAAKNVLLGGGAKKKNTNTNTNTNTNMGMGMGMNANGNSYGNGEDGLSDKVTGAYKRWHERLVGAVRAALPDVAYGVSHTESLVGLFSCIFVKSKERMMFGDVAVTTIKRGMGGRYGNKGGIVARLVVGDSSICFINCHLAAGQNAVRRRNADVAGMLEEKSVFAPTTEHPRAYIRGGDGTMVLDHEFVIMNGDMNYRIDHRRDAILAAIRLNDLPSLLPYDQLLREIKSNRGCRLRGFSEGALTFPPTYKYDPHSSSYDTSAKHRAPAWCDRVLWRARVGSRVRMVHYRRWEVDVSDHRPVSAVIEVRVKREEGREGREGWRGELEERWREEQERLLGEAREFYVSQALI